ncbi:SubName: Full=Probable translocon subunit {ECO:0000313/EMBL:CCA68357.1} [Serendipita indica DSM 11827]|nr:SubName: Full=Probable translocon subunit {ECO:0000313/EMBL:CCA68357.1} [Serendipita indica DSM 11827]
MLYLFYALEADICLFSACCCSFTRSTWLVQSDSDRPSSPTGKTTSSSAVARPPGAQVRRRATGSTVQKPNSARAAGAGGSSNTMLKLYTDDSPGLRVDPFVVLILSLSFIGSIFFLHISAKIIRSFSK